MIEAHSSPSPACTALWRMYDNGQLLTAKQCTKSVPLLLCVLDVSRLGVNFGSENDCITDAKELQIASMSYSTITDG
jgi:hypothetical protein